MSWRAKHRETFGEDRPVAKRKYVRKTNHHQEHRATPKTKVATLDAYDEALARAQELEGHDEEMALSLQTISDAAHAAMRSRDAAMLAVCRYAAQKLGDTLLLAHPELIDATAD